MITRTTSHPTPTRFQHTLEVHLRRAPDPRFTDPLRALQDLEDGLAQPLVEVIEEHERDAVVVQVSLFSANAAASLAEVAALEGLAAELVYESSL